MKNPPSLKPFLFEIVKPHKWLVLGILAVGVLWGITNTLTPYILKLIIDTVVALSNDKAALLSMVMPLSCLYILLWVIFALGMRVLDWLRLKLFPNLRFDIVQKMFSYLGGHSYHYFQNNFAGSLSNKIGDMATGVTSLFSIMDDAFAISVGFLIAITALYIIHPVFAGIFSVWLISFLLITWYFARPIRNLSHLFATSRTTLMGKIVDSVSNVANMRLFSRNKYENNLIRHATLETVEKDREMQWYILKMRLFWDMSIITLIAINLYVLVYMYSKNLVSVGDFTFIISLTMTMFYNLWYLASQYVEFSEKLGNCSQALTLMITPHEVADKPNAPSLKVTQGKIEFSDVTFHYDQGRHLFKNKSVSIQPGQKVGLIGFSGSGKSTFVNLILRLFDVESGTIMIDEQNIAEVTQDSLRENITMIPQDITLFHRTLMDNIRYGRIEASDDEVMAASKKAHCHEFIMRLKDGYQSLVGERGIKLSGGQRQRIAIARAMLKDSPILILDEATSSLDSVTEKLIQDSLNLLMSGRTTIVIAHRLSTLSKMDRILVFDNGRIIEDGAHDELIRLTGHYAKMWSMQAGGFLPETTL